MTIQDIIYKECLGSSEIYLYEDEGKWYAYYHSAAKVINYKNENCVINETKFSFCGLILQKIEVNLQELLSRNWYIELCTDNEITLV